jgi:glycosyltransferase involved in cell wall biosynthesis
MPETLASTGRGFTDAQVAEKGSPCSPLDLSVVMPVYNESQALPGVLKEVVEALAEAPFSFELVLVDDASTDSSPSIMREFQQRHPDMIVRILRHQTNRGIMATCKSLFGAASGKYVFVNASDGQCRSAECLRMMKLRDQFDIVVGKRRSKKYTPGRAVVSALFNVLPRLLFGVRTFDAGSIKLFRKDVLDIQLLSRGPFQEAERLVRARRRGYRVGAIPVEHGARVGGTATGARWGLIGRSIVDLWRCWWDIVILGHD